MASYSAASTSQLQAEVTKVPAHLTSQAVPIRIRQSSNTIIGTPTNVIVQEFADQALVIVSQLGKVGCLSQITIQKRPNYSAAQAAFDLDDDDAVEKHFARQANLQSDPVAVSDSLSSEQAAMLGNCHQQRLFGTHPPGKKSLYDLYNIHIALQTQQALASTTQSNDTGSLSEKPIVVGLALQQKHTTTSQEEEDEDENFDILANDERERFEGILALVKQACNS
ncbi:uncharacterized protein FA14DRAFT_191659 [Meira miltonrushii]|uniref:Proteasome assembly chaperone 3 n=1 Tax=Meira miltonrushii TaxID=1280837 RepID=A0A316V4U6_9BASI|nr:uncharacterized protein FA14DRAFT_191659 [Meira miltonrushii]PWN32566.1 hypothetical protein FA14DRAFT_191659 [Meira miltonrushii]